MLRPIAILSFFCLFTQHQAFSQDILITERSPLRSAPELTLDEPDNYTEVVMSDELSDYIHLADSLEKENAKTTGYRIQLYSGSGPNAKKNALQFQSEFLNSFQDAKSYTLWNYPNWVVRAGDFRTHLSALEFHEVVKIQYPASFIIKDEIKVRP